MRIVSVFLLLALIFQSCKKESVDSNGKKMEHIYINQDSIDQVINDTLFEKQSESVKELYKIFDKEIIWTSEENRKTLFENIKNKCEEEGLFVENYALSKLLAYEKNREELNYYEFQKYDILLSKAFKNLANQLHKGIINPREVYGNWDANYRNPIFNNQIASAIKNEEITALLDKAIATHEPYLALKKQYQLHKELPEDAFINIPNPGKLIPNSNAAIVPKIKKKLVYFGYLNSNDESTLYDDKTVNAIKKFQENHGLPNDGVIGGGTISELNTSRSKRIKQILIGMERAKWYPNSLSSHYIYVNLPEFKVFYVKDNDTVDSKKVVIGTLKRKTPVLTSTIHEIVFNPTWTVPPTIVKEDLTPAATKSRGYFAASRITIKDSKGNIVDPKDWKPENAGNYRYIQSSGYDNSLGLVKFNFHNRFSVYLHDTNHREYFAKTNRALSSGCVRIEEPLAFTKTVLMKEDEEKWKDFEIDSIIKRAETKSIPIKNNIKIYQFYLTSWAKNNVLSTRKDVYGYDEDLYKRLRNQSILN